MQILEYKMDIYYLNKALRIKFQIPDFIGRPASPAVSSLFTEL